MWHASSVQLIGRRLLIMIPVLLGISLVTFGVLGLLPGSAAQQLLGAEATPELVTRLEAELNLDRPAWQRYWEWLGAALTGDLGRSLASQQPVAQLLGERIGVTLELLAYAFVLALGLAVPTALLAAHGPNRLIDRLSTILSMAALSFPSYVLGLILVLVFAVELRLFPSIGFTPLTESLSRNIWSLTLPAAAIALPLSGFYARFLRGELVEQMQGEGYVLAAMAKGIGPWRVLSRHAFRNSLFGLLTLVGLNFATLAGGTVVIEQIFALPGVGQLLLQAVNARDVIVVQAIVLVLAVVTAVANLCVDLLYMVLDPRIRHGAH